MFSSGAGPGPSSTFFNSGAGFVEKYWVSTGARALVGSYLCESRFLSRLSERFYRNSKQSRAFTIPNRGRFIHKRTVEVTVKILIDKCSVKASADYIHSVTAIFFHNVETLHR